jgi:CheY-like chemotaxis protein
MRVERRTISILVAEDDEDDRLLTEEAFREAKIKHTVHFVKNGEEVLDYLCRRNRYTEAKLAPRPGLILLDLNMPKKDGREVLKEIKSNPNLRQIPVVILTTSQDNHDIDLAYELGANSFIVKPRRFDGLVKIIKTLGSYWFDLVELPQY